MTTAYTIRDARVDDGDTLVAFTLREGAEAEGLALDAAAVRRGVAGAFRDPPLARTWVAEHDGRVVANVSVVTEWSNFRGGHYWWIQSVFILPEHRGAGLVALLLEHVTGVARAAGALDLRLYAHSTNERALGAYQRCGFTRAPYALMIRRL